MNANQTTLSTGLPGLDRVLQGLLPGDNVVWEVDGIQDYAPVVGPLVRDAQRRGRKLIYFRFARHGPLVPDAGGAEVRHLDPQEGFERFLSEILDVIERAGPGAYYVFDCLSELAADWFSDRMLGNFFMITCPFLYKLDTIAYFALQKNLHTFHATHSIFNTAQVILEIYRKDDRLFVHPMKVWQRHTPTMYTLHRWEGADFRPVTSSATITDILGGVPKPCLEFAIHRPGVWTRSFQEAQQTLHELRSGQPPGQDPEPLVGRLVKMLVTREERLEALVRKYVDLGTLVEVMQRMVGTGQIGGKALGMLLARAILRKSDPRWAELLESHDSFYVGADVFYTYLVQNDCWWLRRRVKDFNVYLQRAAQARERILAGAFPDYIQHQFMEMLEYFGQSPLIVRSSSLLEDNYGNAFSGKYESVFCVNQGRPAERLEAFLNAVRTVYASALSDESLRYRLHHGLLDRDEQMALLVQRVSGEVNGHLFFPQVAGVGFSFNPFVWHEDIDPKAGLLRLVFGLGTRAVDRTDDDYTRLVALNAPLMRPDHKSGGAREYTQRRVDVLDLSTNQLAARGFEVVARAFPPALMELFATRDEPPPARAPDPHAPGEFAGVLTFQRMLEETGFAATMRDLCRVLEEAYSHPVDIEFTANFTPAGKYRINLVQCRPFQVKVRGEGSRMRLPDRLAADRLLFECAGPIIGHSLATVLDRVIYVAPAVYSQMGMSQRYSVARTIGRLTHLESGGRRPTLMLIGPGRWGTSMPSLGVPVSFAEINRVSVLCELTLMHAGLVPDVSLGTHFFNDLVEMDMLYLAVSPGREGHVLNESLLAGWPNQLTTLLPAAGDLAPALWVVDAASLGGGGLLLNVDSMKQRAVCYWEPDAES